MHNDAGDVEWVRSSARTAPARSWQPEDAKVAVLNKLRRRNPGCAARRRAAAPTARASVFRSVAAGAPGTAGRCAGAGHPPAACAAPAGRPGRRSRPGWRAGCDPGWPGRVRPAGQGLPGGRSAYSEAHWATVRAGDQLASHVDVVCCIAHVCEHCACRPWRRQQGCRRQPLGGGRVTQRQTTGRHALVSSGPHICPRFQQCRHCIQVERCIVMHFLPIILRLGTAPIAHTHQLQPEGASRGCFAIGKSADPSH